MVTYEWVNVQRSHLAAAANLIKAREPLRKPKEVDGTNWAVIKATKSITRKRKTIKAECWALVDLQILLSTRLNCRYRNRITIIAFYRWWSPVLYCHCGRCVNSRSHPHPVAKPQRSAEERPPLRCCWWCGWVGDFTIYLLPLMMMRLLW